ncbi:HesA/MoeB/ThiF family protein [Kribbella sp. CA-294648]|uniref:HesA/MoeB/ThiF family protein n=1 Tax=Kribbella sp. CA-294648 TaxID=3239948 RepID=UPI003D8D0169
MDLTPRASRYDVQARLKASSVVVLGLGGTGSAVASALVAAGVGAVHCVDFDIIEEGNLTRQLRYTEEDLGKPKVPVAVKRLSRMNSHGTDALDEAAIVAFVTKVSGRYNHQWRNGATDCPPPQR